MASTQSPLLDLLPPELRLHIYSHLLVAPVPLKGQQARGASRYNLQTSILRTNHQIYDEARPVFFGKNAFYITSSPSTTSTEDEVGSGAFEPPLQLKDLSLVRHLQIDILFYPKILRVLTGPRYGGWTPVCPAAERYIGSLTYLLSKVKRSLLSLRLCADTRRYLSSIAPTDTDSLNETEEDELDVRKVLTGFHMADRIRAFKATLAISSIRTIELRFDFPESTFGFDIATNVLCKMNLASLAGQVLIARNDIEMKAALEELGEGQDGPIWEEGTVHLWPSVTSSFQRQAVETQTRRLVQPV